LRCNTCTHYFSETRGTIFFGLETPDDEILRTLALVPEKGSIRGTAKTTSYFGGCINTSCIERINLTIRNSLARFIRKGMNYSKNAMMHSRAIGFFQAWYNFVKPHKSLRLTVNCGNKKWLQRTPAMAQKLTDHIWTLKELLTFRVPVQ
jgi:hypothetical protein